MLGSPCSPCCGCRSLWQSMLGMNCTLNVTGVIPRRDAATFASPGAAHGIDTMPPASYQFIRDQTSYTFGSYALALNSNPAKTYWVDAPDSYTGYAYGRVQFLGGDARCDVRADYFVVPTGIPSGEQVAIDEWDLTAGTKKTIGNCVVYAAARVRSTSQLANATQVPPFTSGTVTVTSGPIAWPPYRWLKTTADGYTRSVGYPSDSLSFVPSDGWQYDTRQLVVFSAFWKSASLPSGVTWRAASELDDVWLFSDSQPDSQLMFSTVRYGSMISTPSVWQSYSEQGIQLLSQARWASDITFLPRVEMANNRTRGPWPVTSYTPASQYYGPVAGTYTYSLPVSLLLE